MEFRTRRNANASAGDAVELDTREETVPEQGRKRTLCLLPNRKTNIWPSCRRRRVLIALSAVDLLKSVIPERVANISDKTRTIQEGEVIAACAPVTCVDRKCNSQDLSSEDLVKNLLQNNDRRETDVQQQS
ncbi:hypothetical protein TNCV_2997041 [Trichonephila clavipes]|nr:hypothetical protein TNCV_2997041 [Trichonephila clavipes]